MKSFILVVLSLFVCNVTFADTLKYKSSTYTFNQNRVKAEDLKNYLEMISPNARLLTEDMAVCRFDVQNIAVDFENCPKIISKFKAKISELEPVKVPYELKEVKQYVKKHLEMLNTANSYMWQYAQTKNASLLTRKSEFIDLSKNCKSQADAVGAALSDDERYRALTYKWYGCVAGIIQSERYPQKVWIQFMKKSGVTQKITP